MLEHDYQLAVWHVVTQTLLNHQLKGCVWLVQTEIHPPNTSSSSYTYHGPRHAACLTYVAGEMLEIYIVE